MSPKFIDYVERPYLKIWQILILFIAFGFSRSYLEIMIFNYNWTWGIWENILHTTSYYLFFSTLLLLLIKIFTGESIKKIMNAMVKFYWIIITPPIIDKFLFNQRSYFYLQPGDFWRAITTFINIPPYVGTGQRIEILTIIVLLVIYILFKKNRLWKSLTFSLSSGFIFYVSIIYFGIPKMNPIFNFFVDGVSSNFYWLYSQWVLFFFFTTFSMVFLFITFIFEYRKLIFKFLTSFKDPLFFLYSLLLIFGLKISAHAITLDAPGYWDLIAAILSLLSLTLMWIFYQSILYHNKNAMGISLTLAIFVTFIFGIFPILLFSLLLLILYSFRYKMKYVELYPLLEISLASSLLFGMGVFIPKFAGSQFIPPTWYFLYLLIFLQFLPLSYYANYLIHPPNKTTKSLVFLSYLIPIFFQFNIWFIFVIIAAVFIILPRKTINNILILYVAEYIVLIII